MRKCFFTCYFIGSVVKIVLSEAATRGVLYKMVFLKKVAKFTGKHLCQSLFFNKFAGATDVFYHLNLKIFEHSL